MIPSSIPEPLRPRDLALLLLASDDLLPRQRARDQQSDRAGLDLKRQLLDRLAALDPEPEELEVALARLVEEIGPPTGPTRALALAFRQEWEMAGGSPEYVRLLLEQAARQSGLN